MQSILDKIYTNVANWFEAPVILPAVTKSDHESVLLTPSICPQRPRRQMIQLHRRSSDPSRKTLLCDYLRHFNWTPLFALNNCPAMVDDFYSIILSALDYYLPMVTVVKCSTDKPWVTPSFRNLVKSRQRAFLAGDLASYHRLRNRTQRMANKLRKNYFETKVEQLHTSDPHQWWTRTKRLLKLPDSNPFANLDCQDSPDKLAETINNFFVSVSAHLPEVVPDILAKLTGEYSDEFIIEPSVVENRLAKINIYKAPGPDGIPSWLLRDFAPFLCQPLAAIFNASIREGYVPPIWKSAEVIPVPKVPRPQSYQTDLRPISLPPCVAKILESIIGQWVASALEPTFDPNQFGCRRQRSTTHALVAMIHEWQTALDQGGAVRALLVDFRKAFDSVNHNLLLQKLYNKNVPHQLIKWFFSYLQQRSQRVRGCS